MKAICTDGTEIECENFRAIDSGVLLTKDRKRNKVIGFVPNGDLRYVVPEDTETEHRREIESRTAGNERTDGEQQVSERERSGEGEREEIAALRERLDRLEARVDLSATDHTERAGRSVSTATIEERSRDPDSGRDRPDTSDLAGVAAAETRAEPTPDSETELLSGSSDAGNGEQEEDRSEREASGNRTAVGTTGANTDIDTGADTDAGGETKRVGTSGFDPVAVVAEQRESKERSHRTEQSEREAGADTGTIDIGRSDPVATIARQGGESTTRESEAGEANETDSGAAEPASSAGDDREGETEPRTELQRIDGLGPTYADRLAENGIETLADVEETDPEGVASIAEVSESRAEEWIEQASELPA
jgi:predicted flap endonuclease-1-like 5' DNA nuclease